MIEFISRMLSFDFMQRALIVGILVSLCAALLGVCLVLKRFSMIGDGLSHVGYGAIAIAVAMNWAPMYLAMPVVIVAAFLLLRLSRNSRIKGDAAIALMSSSALAIGMIVLAVKKVNIDVNSYMFGSIFALEESDVVLSIICSVVVLVLYIVFYNRIFGITFDESFSKATGVKADLYNMVVALLTALIIVVGMRLMGALLISSLVIFPALTSMRVCKSFRGVTICSVAVSVLCYLAGLVITFCCDVPAGACIVVVNLAVFIVFAGIGAVKKR